MDARMPTNIPLDLPRDEYLHRAWTENKALYRREKTGAFRTEPFEFLRFVKARPELKKLNASEAYVVLDQWRSTLHFGGKVPSWSELFPETDDPVAEFFNAWDMIRVPAGEKILSLAASHADSLPLRPAEFKDSPYFARLISIAGHLQRLLGNDKMILLPWEGMSVVMGCHTHTVGNCLRMAMQSGYLTRVRKGHKPSGTAAGYRFDLDRFDFETGEEIVHKGCKEGEESEGRKDVEGQEKIVKSDRVSKRTEGTLGILSGSERKKRFGTSDFPPALEGDAMRKRIAHQRQQLAAWESNRKTKA